MTTGLPGQFGPEPADGPLARCYRHPNREAGVRCTRCDRPICPDCMRPASVGFHCPDDVAIASRAMRPQRTSVGGLLRQSPPYVTGSLVGLNVIVYLVTGHQSSRGYTHVTAGPINGLFNNWQLVPQLVHDDGDYYRLLTSAFLHVSFLHIASNMLALAIVGPPLERLLGRWRFVSVYLLSALGGSAAVYLFGARLTPVVGASGAIFGLFGACLVLVRRLGLDAQWLVGIIALNFVLTFSIGSISKLGHIGGFVVGCAAAMAIGGLPVISRAAAGGGRLSLTRQLVGLGVVAAAVLVGITVRTATFS
jgi:membrane associated rhomboid family serine protease